MYYYYLMVTYPNKECLFVTEVVQPIKEEEETPTDTIQHNGRALCFRDRSRALAFAKKYAKAKGLKYLPFESSYDGFKEKTEEDELIDRLIRDLDSSD